MDPTQRSMKERFIRLLSPGGILLKYKHLRQAVYEHGLLTAVNVDTDNPDFKDNVKSNCRMNGGS